MPKSIDREFPVKVGSQAPTLFVQARTYMGPKQVVIERQSGGLIILSLPEARALVEVLQQAIAELGGGA